MMPAPLFELFEFIAEELSVTPSQVITHHDLRTNGEDSPLLEVLMNKLKAPSTEDVIPCAVRKLREHFKSKGAKLPFGYSPKTGRFTAIDADFLSFVTAMSEIRSIGRHSQLFECTVADRLRLRVTGSIHRVGFPRRRRKSQKEFNGYLRKLGFHRPVLYGKDKDGGFDILWLLPIGTTPHRPIVSVQCKNGVYDKEKAGISVDAANDSLAQHAGLRHDVHVPCVLFNDYISPEMLKPKRMGFVPLGLTDLAALKQSVSVEYI